MYFRFVKKFNSGPGLRKTLKQADYPEMEAKFYAWFIQQRDRHVTLSFDMLVKKARKIFKQCYKKGTFVASRGWLLSFKGRHGLLKICGEKRSKDESAKKPFIEKLSQIIKEKEFLPSQIYNADESDLFWNMLPQQTLVRSKEKATDKNANEGRITFLACTNENGSHKLKLLVMGKSKNPKVFRNKKIPVEYTFSKNTWMTSSIFKDWFHNSFCKQVQIFLRNENLPEKALLLIHNAPTNCNEEELISENGNMSVMFLPPNSKALIQQMNQNGLIKLFYRKILLVHLFAMMDQDGNVNKCLNTINIQDAVCLLHNAWQKVLMSSLEKCWTKLLTENYLNVAQNEPEDSVPLSLLRERKETIDSVSSMLETISEEQSLTERDVFQWAVNENQISEYKTEDKEEEQQQHSNRKIKHEMAIKYLTIAIQWAEENNISLNKILLLKKIREEGVIKLHTGNKKQKKITDFFKKYN